MNKEQLIKNRYNEQFFEDITFDYATPIQAVRAIEKVVGKEAGKHTWNCVYGYDKHGGRQGFIPLTPEAETMLDMFDEMGDWKASYQGYKEYKKEPVNYRELIYNALDESNDQSEALDKIIKIFDVPFVRREY